MLKAARYALLALALYALTTSGPACAWSITNMFSSGNSPSSTSAKPAKKSSSNRRQAPKPGVVDTLTGAPKKLYTNTKAMVTPSKKATSATRPRTDTWKPKSAATASTQKPSGIKGWFVPEPAPQPRTVGEWMKQKRVEP
jgi:hypothetical protein